MSQDLDFIINLLREIKQADNLNSDSFSGLLNKVCDCAETLPEDTTTTELLKEYLKNLSSASNEYNNLVFSNLSDVSEKLKEVIENYTEHGKSKGINKAYNTLVKNLGELNTLKTEQVEFFSDAEKNLSNLSDKPALIEQTALINKYLQQAVPKFRIAFGNLNTNIKTITNTISKGDVSKLSEKSINNIEHVKSALEAILTHIKDANTKTSKQEELLAGIVSGEGLKTSHGMLESVIEQSEKISDEINKIDLDTKQESELDSSSMKKEFAKITLKTENLTSLAEEIKQTLAKVTSDIENLPNTTVLEDTIKKLYIQLESLGKDVATLTNKNNIHDVDTTVSALKKEFVTIKNIVSDLNEVIASKVLSAVKDISFANESYDIKQHVSIMLSKLPQKEDIDRILYETDTKNKSINALIKKTDELSEKVDKLPTKEALYYLDTESNLSKKLDEAATKYDIDGLSSKADEIEQMIDNLNFDDEFENIYNKTASLEDWLVDSKIKEHTEELTKKSSATANKEDILPILNSTERIISILEKASTKEDSSNVAEAVTALANRLEEIKVEVLNTAGIQNDTIISKISELKNSVETITTGEDFNRFIDDLREFTCNITSDTNEISETLEENKNLQKDLLARLNELDLADFAKNLNGNIETLTKDIESALANSHTKVSEQVSEINDKITTLSEYINKDNSEFNTDEFNKEIREIKELLENKKSNFEEINGSSDLQISAIEQYISEAQNVLQTSATGLSEEIKTKISTLEDKLFEDRADSANQISKILEKLEYYENLAKEEPVNREDLTHSFSEISEIKERILKLGESFDNIGRNSSPEKETANFISDKFQELSFGFDELAENIEKGMQHGFVYNAQLLEEKTSTLLELIKELRHSETDNIELFERLTVTDNKLMDIRQELELINTDIVNNFNSKTDTMVSELAPIREMLTNLSTQLSKENNDNIKEQLEILHNSVQGTLTECTKYSKSAFDKAEDTYNKIYDNFSNSENDLRDFILGDIDSVIIKVDNLKEELEKYIQEITPPSAEQMEEFREFIAQIKEFKLSQQEYLKDVAEDIKTSVSETVNANYNEVKSMLTVALNNKEITGAIDDVKDYFKAKIKELEEFQTAQKESSDEFSANQFEKVFENDKSEEILNEIKTGFSEFTRLVDNLSDKNAEIEEVLDEIKERIDKIKIEDLRSQTETQSISAKETVACEKQDMNFDFIEAFDLLKQEVNNLRKDIEHVLPESFVNNTESDVVLDDKLLLSLNNKIDLLSKTLNTNWLEDVKEYLSGSSIQSILEDINKKIDNLAPADNSALIEETKQALNDLMQKYFTTEPDSEIKTMLGNIDNKIDDISLCDNIEIADEIKSIIEKAIEENSGSDIEKDIEISETLDKLDKKIDILAASENINDFEEIKDSLIQIDEKVDALSLDDSYQQVEDLKYTILGVDEKLEALTPVHEKVERLSEADTKITSMLELLNHKIDIISDNDEIFQTVQDIEEVKTLISSQLVYLEQLEQNDKTDVVKKCLDELTTEVNSLSVNTENNTTNVQKILKDMKESIMAAVVTIFEQVSFIEESEDIKDFVEEKTDLINKNLTEVTNRLKQITSSANEEDYNYSMQDIESDLAKIRLALNELHNNEMETQSGELAAITSTLDKITASVEELQNSMTQDEIKDLKADVSSLQEQTEKLLISSDESYNAINCGLEDFGKNITSHISSKVDNVTKLLEKSSDSDKVMRQALIYLGEWIDSASESMNKISTNSDEILDVKYTINELKNVLPEQTDILNNLAGKFEQQQQKLAGLEKEIFKLSTLENQFEEQQERIDRLEHALDKILSAVEDIDDTKVTKKIDKIDKQLAKLSINIEKLTSYVD